MIQPRLNHFYHILIDYFFVTVKPEIEIADATYAPSSNPTSPDELPIKNWNDPGAFASSGNTIVNVVQL